MQVLVFPPGACDVRPGGGGRAADGGARGASGERQSVGVAARAGDGGLAVPAARDTMADGVELTGISVDGGRLEVPGASSRDPSDDEGPSSSRASPRVTPRGSPRLSPRPSPRASPGISPSGSSGDLAGDGSSGAYRQRKITPASGGIERYKPRSSPTPGAPGRKMSKMELEALRDRKRNGHLKELERLLNEALPGTGSVFTPDGFVTAITSPVRRVWGCRVRCGGFGGLYGVRFMVGSGH